MVDLPQSIAETPSIASIALIVGVCALAAYSTTWLLRGILPQAKQWHWKLRLCALLTGTLVGWSLAGYPWGIAMGLSSGGLTTSFVAFVKARLKKASDAAPAEKE